jgi:hypothetical protein
VADCYENGNESLSFCIRQEMFYLVERLAACLWNELVLKCCAR